MSKRYTADVLAVGSLLWALAGFGSVAVSLAFPDHTPRFLISDWYLVVLVAWIPAIALWIWMLIDAIIAISHPRSRDALVWLILMVVLGAGFAWIYYFAQYWPRRASG